MKTASAEATEAVGGSGQVVTASQENDVDRMGWGPVWQLNCRVHLAPQCLYHWRRARFQDGEALFAEFFWEVKIPTQTYIHTCPYINLSLCCCCFWFLSWNLKNNSNTQRGRNKTSLKLMEENVSRRKWSIAFNITEKSSNISTLKSNRDLLA